jgi:hypothetical protein
MARSYLPNSHSWSHRQVSIDGHIFFHRHCEVCLRDFAMTQRDGLWRAVHQGALRFDFLDDETNHRWTTEECPGRPHAKANGQRTQPSLRRV